MHKYQWVSKYCFSLLFESLPWIQIWVSRSCLCHLTLSVSVLAWAAITKYHGLGDLTNRSLFSRSSRDQVSQIKVPTWLVSSEDSLLGLTDCRLLAVSLYDRESESRLSSVFPYKDTTPIMRAPFSWPLLNQSPCTGPSFSEDQHIRLGRAIFSTFSVPSAVLQGGRKSHCTVA